MPSTEFDTLAETRELRAAGIEASHAEAIVSTVGRSVDGLLTESRFDAAMAEQTAYLDKRLAEQRVYLDQRLTEQTAYLEKAWPNSRPPWKSTWASSASTWKCAWASIPSRSPS